MVHSAGIQDRDGRISLLTTMKGLFPLLEKLFADSACQGPLFAKALAKILPRLETEIQTFGSCQGVRAVTQALDRRAHHRLAQPLPPSRQGLGKSQPQRPRVLETCLNPPHAPKALQSLIKFRNVSRTAEPVGSRLDVSSGPYLC